MMKHELWVETKRILLQEVQVRLKQMPENTFVLNKKYQMIVQSVKPLNHIVHTIVVLATNVFLKWITIVHGLIIALATTIIGIS